MWLYKKAYQLKNYLFRKKYISQVQLPVTVVSVGNLTMGGSGKTPFILFLLKELTAQGYRVGVVSRNYKSSFKGSQSLFCEVELGSQSEVVETNNKKSMSLASFYGDEPYLIKRSFPQVRVFVGPSKNLSAKALHEQYPDVDVIIVDDGFQHLKLQRDLDIVLLDMSVTKNHYQLIPWGRMREGFESLLRAQMICYTKTNFSRPETDLYLKKQLSDLGIQQNINLKYINTNLRTLTNPDKFLTLSELKNKKIFAFCGIAQFENFKSTLQDHCDKTIEFKSFGDHHRYSDQDIKYIQEQIYNNDIVVCTQKDAVKLSNLKNLYYLDVEIQTDQKFEIFELIKKTIQNKKNQRPQLGSSL